MTPAIRPYARYFALGDSMCIDRYPTVNAIERGIVRPAGGSAGIRAPADLPLGASALLAHNDDRLWPEFASRDLASVEPDVAVSIFAEDGATTWNVLRSQLPRLSPSGGEPVLVTLTVGGNDLLLAYVETGGGGTLGAAVTRILREYDRCVEAILSAIPGATLLLTTIYDPSDGTGIIPGFHEGPDPLPLRFLEETNAHISSLAGAVPGALLADVHAHFLGHGVRAPEHERWYWPHSLIEPAARGASEIRRVWLDALDSAPARVRR